MKKLLLIAAVASMSAPAFASKARINALGNAAHLIDPQTAFNNPSYNAWMSDYATFEMGSTNGTFATSTSATTTPPSRAAIAEGGFVRSAGDAKYMAYLGRRSDYTSVARQAQGFLGQENPIEIQYAMKGAVNWGVGFNYSSSNKKSTSQKQDAMGVRLGASTDLWEGYGIIGLGSNATGTTATTGNTAVGGSNPSVVLDPDAKYKGTTGFKVGGAYKMENLYFYADYTQDGSKFESAVAGNAALNGSETTVKVTTVGVVDHNKIEGGQWFYGAAYQMTENKRAGGAPTADLKQTVSTLPFLLGVEYDATSWATLRASATQNVLLGSTKTESTATPPAGVTFGESDTIGNNTTVAAGLGLKFNKFVLDASMSAGTTGDVNTTNTLTNASLTYNF